MAGMQGHSVTDFTHHLKGVKFPAGKADLVKLGKHNHASKEMLAVLERLPEREYGTIAEVMHGAKEANA